MKRAIALLALGAALAGCSGSGTTKPQLPAAPVADTPAHTLDLLVWCYDNRDVNHYGTLFTGDYRFKLTLFDSTDATFRDSSMTREEELQYAHHLFVNGVVPLPAATSVALTFGPVDIQPDGRPGKDSTVHREALIASSLNATFASASTTAQVRSPVRFYFVRGDSAILPAELIALGAGHDTTRWYLEGWVDESSSPIGAGLGARRTNAQATFSVTWGELKLLYLSGPPPALPRSIR